MTISPHLRRARWDQLNEQCSRFSRSASYGSAEMSTDIVKGLADEDVPEGRRHIHPHHACRWDVAMCPGQGKQREVRSMNPGVADFGAPHT